MDPNRILPQSSTILSSSPPDPSSTRSGGITWGMLNQKHDEYDLERLEKLDMLLRGEAACHPELFMRKLNAESDAAYADRLQFATYENNFGEIINDYAATLFEKPLSVQPAQDAKDPDTPGEEPDPDSPYMEWQEHFTLDNQNMADFMHDIQTESNALSIAYFGIDFRKREINGQPTSIPYAYYIDPCSVLDWEKDDDGNFIFLVCRDDSSKRTSVSEYRNKTTTTFTVWKKKENKVVLDLYRIEYEKGKEPSESTLVNKVIDKNDDGKDLDFKNIPVIDCITPDNLSLGKLIGQLADSYFGRYSTFLFCLNRGINPILVYKQGAELPANGDLSSIGENDERGEEGVSRAAGEGKAVIGPQDELNWESPNAEAYNTVQMQLEKDKNEMYRLSGNLNAIIGHAGVSTQQTKASGIAKMIDNMNKEHFLTAYANLVKEWVMRAFRVAFDALKVDGLDNTVWDCKGMENYKIVDEDQLLAKITAIPEYKANIPSKTSFKQLLMDIAYEVHPFATVGVMNKILEELEDNVEAMDLDSVHQTVNPQGAIEADSAKQMQGAVPQEPKPAGSQPKVNAPGGSDLQPKQVGETGQQALDSGSHLQDGQHVDWKTVYDALKNDYKPKDLAWVKVVPWRGPVEVDINDISFAGEDEWKANKEGKDGQDKVDKYADIMSDKSFSAFQPVILANQPHNDEKYTIIDGRHRVKAAQQSGVPLLAYIADVSSVDADTPHMQLHSKQQSSGSKSS
jgi:ParB-like nuclease domain